MSLCLDISAKILNQNKKLLLNQLSSFATSKFLKSELNEKKELDDLFKKVVVEVRGHDNAVLESYKTFVQQASKELEINLNEIREPDRFIERWTLLKSRFSNRKHMRQYEMRTYFREFEFKHLTGSTCDTLLEYIQRNLPEGVAMHVHKTKLCQLPEHFS
ncbi:28S ribosomal mitochondrial isoform X1 [Brachionus plicatilis]|uniref:Small ribosomal subunit protein uS10m n=1 Tax=Brachionus plicatilis TaxID=10195 RepID=A0A3M7SQD3_BRAPC|nr:28S ribosomal mitochondrial isoform X1 [Brachionus plicatilis]